MNFHRLLLALLALSWTLAAPAVSASDARFHFVALGDTAYNLDRDLPIYASLIETINSSSPAFSIHVGDTWGVLECSEKNHLWVRGWFDRFDHPLIYTPGDNEWTDCRKPEVLAAYSRVMEGKGTPADRAVLGAARQLDNALAATSYVDTLESLATIRRVFFDQSFSQGAVKLPLQLQADPAQEAGVRENARWERGGVVFATVSVPGSQNGFPINDPRRAAEASARNAANVAWLKAAFAAAEAKDAKAVVIALHASLFIDAAGDAEFGKQLRGGVDGPFYWVALAIRDLASDFGRPVLLIHGDFHQFQIDRPFMVPQGESRPPKYANITRLQVYGAPELRAVRVDVDTRTPWVFSFSPLYADTTLLRPAEGPTQGSPGAAR